MSRFLYKILLVLVSISFYLSATETDIGKCKNTFFDDEDTYVRTETVTFEHVVIDRHLPHAPCLIENNSYYFQQPGKLENQVIASSLNLFERRPPKLYLWNSVLII